MEISRWAMTQATAETKCVRCGSKPGEPCKTPKGRKAQSTHGERTRDYREAIGREEFDRRHSFRVITGSDFLVSLVSGKKD